MNQIKEKSKLWLIIKNFFTYLNNTLLNFSPSFQTYTAYFKINFTLFCFESYLLIIPRTKLDPLLSLLGCQIITRAQIIKFKRSNFGNTRKKIIKNKGLYSFYKCAKTRSRCASNLGLLQKEMILSPSSQEM